MLTPAPKAPTSLAPGAEPEPTARAAATPPRPSGRPLHRWHRRAGIGAAAFLVYLVATGVPLQFSAALELGQRHVHWEPLLDWYGLEAPRATWSSAGLVSVADQLFLASAGTPVASLDGFRGAVSVDGLVAAAGAREVLLLTADGQFVDRFPFDGTVRRIGLRQGRVVVETDSGLRLADPELLNWSPAPPAGPVNWAVPRPAQDAEQFRRHYRHGLLSVERLLQDAHSGRLLGTAGIVVLDVASLLLLFLAVSGLMMWWRFFRR